MPSPNDWTGLTDSELTAENVHKSLDSIKDDLWVAAACADRILDDAAVQRVLLDIGLERTTAALRRSQAVAVAAEDEADSPSVAPESSSRRDALVAHFNEIPPDARLCAIRAVILNRLDLLNTFVEICKAAPAAADDADNGPDAWDDDDPWAESAQTDVREAAEPPVALSLFLTDPLLRSACLLASHQWFSGLGIMFERHAVDLWPYRAAILDSIPEHVHPLSYRDFLPALDPSTNLEKRTVSNPWRTELDWSETPDVRAALAASELAPDIAPAIRDPLPNSRDVPLSADELAEWYKNRIQRIILSTGMIDVALAVVQHAAPQGVPGLDEMGEELSLLARLVYDAPQGDDEVDDDWTLDRWYTMEPLAVVRAYLAHSTPETLAKDIWRLVMPYLFVLESRAERAGKPDPTLRTRILYEYILSSPLETAAVIFEASKPILPTPQRIIQNNEDMARLALACLYGSNSLDEWTTMNQIFECLPAWDINRDDDEEDAADTTIVSLGAYVTPSTTRPRCTASDLLIFFQPLPLTSLSRALDILDVHLESGEILSRWSVPAPLRWFLQSNSDVPEQRSWANRMARRAGGAEDRLNSVDDWEWLLEDMLKLTGKGDSGLRGAFGLLTQDEVLRIFLGGLLSTGNFNIARSLIRSPKNKLSLSSEAIEDICLACSRELYDNASSGNYTTGEMKLAYECLDVPPPSDRLAREKEFIEATSRLSSFNIMSGVGIAISPLEIRLTKDRLSLVSRVLSSNNDAYKHTEVILDLVHKLGLRNNIVAEVKTLAMLADTALQAEDFLRAYETSERMVETVLALRSSYPDMETPEIQEASEVCWVACFQLGRQPEFDDVDKKLSLLGRALELCPPDKLHDVLVAWRRLENEDTEAREERLSYRRDGKPRPSKTNAVPYSATSLRARLQDFHMPSPPLLNTPDAAALASRTFRSVAANFPFRGRSQGSQAEKERSSSGSRRRGDADELSTQATRVFSKGIGWLIGADDE
ncbi:secretory pathway protein Sec39-domain-containing protein [Mycena alexandri]|uniref:Secretory pathway protein Sec39-domain-containing protein n=1 Tax=Mycena alexandri TaxID=1745969 RepID=A0AAD6X6E3_9AGAR|nr:secretory pathway protein Sec39-domain-containing protein [Mycena alexandri]